MLKGHQLVKNLDFCLSDHIYHFLKNLQKSFLSFGIFPPHNVVAFIPVYCEIVNTNLDLWYFGLHSR